MLFLFRAENETRAHDAWALSRFFLSPPAPSRGNGSLVRAIVFNRRGKQKATHAGNSKVPQGPRLKGALCLARGWTMQVFRRKTAKQKTAPVGCCFYFERKTRLELATPTLARIAAPRSKKALPFQTYQLSYFRRIDYQPIRGFRFIQIPIFTCMIFTRKRTGVNIGVKVQTSFAVNNS